MDRNNISSTVPFHSRGVPTLMRDLEDGPQHLVLLFALVTRILGVLELVLEFEEGVFDVFEAVWWRFAVFCTADGRHGDNFRRVDLCWKKCLVQLCK